ncbi:hypothetical protein IWQ62_003607 [Dispira parvispora]|uniref:Uncharacterized protein n=1 Tax=Dispira parvispora TaxID=1520584 RepID=A0A9W8ATV1_9FUNG|nr:hypothetical protein IWQ62_003607 [Dispira parvispora]
MSLAHLTPDRCSAVLEWLHDPNGESNPPPPSTCGAGYGSKRTTRSRRKWRSTHVVDGALVEAYVLNNCRVKPLPVPPSPSSASPVMPPNQPSNPWAECYAVYPPVPSLPLRKSSVGSVLPTPRTPPDSPEVRALSTRETPVQPCPPPLPVIMRPQPVPGTVLGCTGPGSGLRWIPSKHLVINITRPRPSGDSTHSLPLADQSMHSERQCVRFLENKSMVSLTTRWIGDSEGYNSPSADIFSGSSTGISSSPSHSNVLSSSKGLVRKASRAAKHPKPVISSPFSSSPSTMVSVDDSNHHHRPSRFPLSFHKPPTLLPTVETHAPNSLASTASTNVETLILKLYDFWNQESVLAKEASRSPPPTVAPEMPHIRHTAMQHQNSELDTFYDCGTHGSVTHPSVDPLAAYGPSQINIPPMATNQTAMNTWTSPPHSPVWSDTSSCSASPQPQSPLVHSSRSVKDDMTNMREPGRSGKRFIKSRHQSAAAVLPRLITERPITAGGHMGGYTTASNNNHNNNNASTATSASSSLSLELYAEHQFLQQRRVLKHIFFEALVTEPSMINITMILFTNKVSVSSV